MNRNVCFIELTKDENGFIKATQTIDTACIRAYLKSNGIESMIYMDESLPSISDMSEDILSLSDEVLVFVIHEECKEIVIALITYIKELESTEIFVIGDTLCISDENIIKIESNQDEKLMEALGNGFVNAQSDILSVSPYGSGILLSRDIPKYGIWLGRGIGKLRKIEAIKEDIAKLVATYSGLSESVDKVITFHGMFIEEKGFFEAIIEQLIKIDMPFLKFVLPVHSSLICEVITSSKYANQCKFKLKFDLALDDENMNSLLTLIQAQKVFAIYFPAEWLLEQNKFVSIVVSAQKAKLLTIFPVGEVDSEKVDIDIKSVILENTRLKYLSFYRGILKSKTGLYAGVKLDGYVHHVEIPDELYSKGTNDFMNEILCANSSISVTDKKTDVVGDRWIFDECGTARVNDRSFDNHMHSFSQSSLNPSNLIVIDKNKVHINSLAYVTDSGLSQISYKEAKRNISYIKDNFFNQERELYIFSLSDEEDFEMFLQDAEDYKNTHELKDKPMAYGYLENSCRFVISSECPVDKIPRIKIDNDGNIHTCDLQVEPIAKLGAPIFELSHNCFAKREKEFQERGCSQCSIRPWCPKCTEMPLFMKKVYCDIMKKNTYVLDYALIPYVFYGLIETNPQFRELAPYEVKVSNEHMFNIISSDICGEVAPYLPKFTSILLCRGKYLMWSPISNKYFNVSVEFACIIELLLKRVKVASLPDLLSTTLKIDLQDSKEITKAVTDTLKKAGVLYRDIE